MKFYAEKDLALCGLVCSLCSQENCPGCKQQGCQELSDCTVYQCVIKKGLDGCYQCSEFPCPAEILQNPRNRAFNQYARQFGKQALLDRLRINYENGITYHRPGELEGDYDMFTTEAEILRLLQFGTPAPDGKSPELETEQFTLRLVQTEDAESSD